MARRGPKPHGDVHVYDDKGFCHLCDIANRRRQAEFRERQRRKGLVLRHGYWVDPSADVLILPMRAPRGR